MPDKEEFNKYDNEIIDTDEIEGTDIKINPDYFIHKAMAKIPEALTNPDMKMGFIQFRQLAEYVETLCSAASLTGKEYEEALKKFKEKDDYKNAADDVKSTKIAREKIRLLMIQVFANKTATFKLKI
jgi:hypothetical protein